MELPPFLLDHWLSRFEFSSTPIRYNLASSTGPRWTFAELIKLGDVGTDLGKLPLGYAHPQGIAKLREAVAAFLDVDPDWVVITTGASEGLSILFCLLERANGNVVVPDPAYPAYAAMAQAWRLGVKSYLLKREQGFAQNPDDILAATDPDTVTVVVNTPHNPTGSIMTPADLAHLAHTLAATGAPLLVDEVYHPLYFGPSMPSAAGTENVVVIGDLSKALSLPGLRMGWIVDRDPERRQRIIDARSYFTISSSPLLEEIAAHVLRQNTKIIARLNAIAQANMRVLQGVMAELAGIISWSAPPGGTTAFPWFADGRDSRPFCERLGSEGILVAPGDCFGHPAHFRLGFAQQEVGFDHALMRLASIARE